MATNTGLGEDYLKAKAEVIGTLAPQATTNAQRIGYGALSLPFNALKGVGSSLGLYDPSATPTEEVAATSLDPSETLTGKGIDLVMQGLLPAGVEMMLTGKVARAALPASLSKYPVAERMAIDAAQLGQLGLHEDKLTGAEQAAEGAGYGYLSKYGRLARLPAAAGLAYLSKLFFDRNGEQAPIASLPEVSQGDLAALIGGVTALLPGKKPWHLPDHFATVAKTADDVVPSREPLALEDRPLTGEVMPDEVLRLMSAEGVNPNAVHTGYTDPTMRDVAPSPARLSLQEPAASRVMRSPQAAAESQQILAQMAERSGLAQDQVFALERALEAAGMRDQQQRIETAWQMIQRHLQQTDDQIRQADNYQAGGEMNPQRGRTPTMPEHLRTQGGFTINDLLAPMGRGTLGALAGGAAGAATGEEGGAAYGAAIGAGAGLTPEVLRLLIGIGGKLKGKVGGEEGMIRDPFFEKPIGKQRIISTAVKLPDGQVVTGDKWNQKHATLFGEALEAGAHPKTLLDDLGFLIEDKSGMVRWADRYEAARIAKEAGQVHPDHSGKLISEELRTEIPNPNLQPLQRNPELFDFEMEGIRDSIGNPNNTILSIGEDAAINLQTSNLPKSSWMPPDAIYISGMASRQKGGGTELMRRAAQKAVNENRPLAWDKSPEAQGFYTKLGFKPDVNGNFVARESELRTFLNRTNTGGLKPLNAKESAYVFPEMGAAMSRAVLGSVAGGSIGGVVDGKDGFFPGAMIGAAAATFGPALARQLLGALGKARTSPSVAGAAAAVPKGPAKLARSFGQVVEEMSGRAFSSSATPAQRFVRWLDHNLGITMPPIIRESLMKSKGLASNLMDIMDQSMMKTSVRFKPSQELKNLSNTFLDDSVTMSKDDYLKKVKEMFPEDDKAMRFAEFITTSRETIDGLQRMVAEGVDAKTSKIINESIGKYLTRSFKLFTKDGWEPDQETVRKLAGKMVKDKVWPDATLQDMQAHLNQYAREVKMTKGMYSGAKAGSTGAKIDQYVLKKRVDLDKEWRDFLGEITDPVERIYQTAFRLRPMAESAHYINDLVKGVKEDGWLPHTFNSYKELHAFEDNLLQQLQNAPAGTPEAAAAAAKLEKFRLKWEGHQAVDEHPKFGELSNSIVTRNVWDTLQTYDTMTDTFKSPLMRLGANFHTAVKLGRTAFNPITTIRNFVTMPAFMAIARVGVPDIVDAAQVIHGTTPELKALREEIMKMGIGNVDQVKTEFFKNYENVTGSKFNFGEFDAANLGLGKLDLDVLEKAGRRGVRKILDVYRYPDNLVRIGSYLAAKRRFSASMKLPETNQAVMDAAMRFTNRYTMNYDAVSPLVKTMRQVPFFNLFLTYTAEMTRLLKNLGTDLVKGSDGISHDRLYAALPLGLLAAVPEMAQSASEASLSPSDKIDWEKAKKLMPDYARTRYRFVTGRDKKTGEFNFVDFTPWIASDSINQTVKAIATGDASAAASVNPVIGLENTPLINIISAQVAGKDLKTHREFRDMKDRFATIAKETLPPLTPGVGSEAIRFEQAHATNAAGGQGTTNLKTGFKVTPSDFWTPYWSGIRTGRASLGVLQQKAVAEAKSDIANETAYLKDVMNSDLPLQTKEEARAKFIDAVSSIQENLRQLIETDSDRK